MTKTELEQELHSKLPADGLSLLARQAKEAEQRQQLLLEKRDRCFELAGDLLNAPFDAMDGDELEDVLEALEDAVNIVLRWKELA